MKLGLSLPHLGAKTTPARIVDFAQRAESVGFDSLWALERLLRAAAPKNAPAGKFALAELPEHYSTVFDPLETLTYVAAKTTTIQLGTSVMTALFHTPVVLARRFATLDHFSGGRVIVGLGQGWSADEFDAAGVPMSRRGNGFAEYIEALRAAWGPDPVSFEGRWYRIPPSQIGPKPLQPGGFKILVGASPESDASVERAGRNGLGLHPMITDWETFEHQLAVFHAAVPANSEPGPIVLRVSNPITETPIDEAIRAPLSGSVDQIKDDFHRAIELGIEHIMWDLNRHVPYETQLRLLEPLIAARPG